MCGRLDLGQFESHRARLFPLGRPKGKEILEYHATSALLAMVCAVTEFGRIVVKDLGGPRGRIHCFTEIPLSDSLEKLTDVPRCDGVIAVLDGKGQEKWRAIVEVKIGANTLEEKQVNTYRALAKKLGFDAFLTVSSQTAAHGGLPPVKIAYPSSKLTMKHWSWPRLLNEARRLANRKLIQDTDQAWMLQEWISFVKDARTGILEPLSLGKHWGDVLPAARKGHLTALRGELQDVVTHWASFLRKLALRLYADTGAKVQVAVGPSKGADHQAQIKWLLDHALERKALIGKLRFPAPIGHIEVTLRLPGRTVEYSLRATPPKDKSAKGCVGWLVKQIGKKDFLTGLHVKTLWGRGKTTLCEYGELLQDSRACVLPQHKEKIPRDVKCGTSGWQPQDPRDPAGWSRRRWQQLRDQHQRGRHAVLRGCSRAQSRGAGQRPGVSSVAQAKRRGSSAEGSVVGPGGR